MSDAIPYDDKVRFVDTSFRDGQQSLWAENMRTDMMLAVADRMNRARFAAMEVIGTSVFKKCVRELREDPWERIRLLAARLPDVPMTLMGGAHQPDTFGRSPRGLTKLWWERLVANGIRRVQIMEPSNDIRERLKFPVQSAKAAGLQVIAALVYTPSPRHTDEYYAQKTIDAFAIGADAIFVEDASGLLTPERVRTLVPAVLTKADGRTVELHAHCSTGLAPLCYVEAIRLGIRTVHTAIPPLANGASQPSVFNVAHNVRALGLSPVVDEVELEKASKELTILAARNGLQAGAPVEYDHAQYRHQIPGGVISNLKHQLVQLGMADRLQEVLDESVIVQRELGYPLMVTPFSQFVVSQAAINVVLGERYREVTDELIEYALGRYGFEASGNIDPATRDRILDRPRAAELSRREEEDVPLEKIRQKFGGAGVSDDELLLRYLVGGREDVDRMREAAHPQDRRSAFAPLLDLLRQFSTGSLHAHLVQIDKAGFHIILQKRTRRAEG